ncbi:hypothetical protein EMCG_03192 [[Emmonsia] crescens]|uniref:MADS-box domain-containing protein n=1 Tax=[Emmonsia] crescens TaxID=73230 RepID=A0A0G2HW05_9EURO|nr:hypothetical protein EMCG_03192 [Emmonsia crescens UAMH 3008]
MQWPQLTLENNQPHPHPLQSPVEPPSSPDSIAYAGGCMPRQRRTRLPPHQANVQRRYRRRRCLFHKVVEYIDRNEAQGYILIDIHGQYFILNTDTSGTWPPSEEQIEKHYPPTVRKTCKDYQLSSKKRRGRTETLFRKSVEYSDKCSADVYVIIYVNNRYLTLYTNGNPPPLVEQTVRLLESSLSALTDLQQAYHYPPPIYETPDSYR